MEEGLLSIDPEILSKLPPDTKELEVLGAIRFGDKRTDQIKKEGLLEIALKPDKKYLLDM
jgi:hypothetical protein